MTGKGDSMKSTGAHGAINAVASPVEKLKNGDTMAQKDMTKASADELSQLLKLDENRTRGQTHGHGDSSIGGIAGCISLKRRQGATHYVGVFKVANMANDTTPRMVKTRQAVKGASYAVHCFAHGTQRPVPSRRAGMHSVRCAGKQPTGAFAKGAIASWCNGCVKGQSKQD